MAPRLLRTGIALALACGLMVPTGALAASEDEARENATNILKPASGYGAGLRCGKTSTLVIDDENPNIVAGGSKLNVNDIITPKKGKVGFDGASLNGTAVRADSSLDLLDSEKPGTLKAYARSQSAAIGGSPQRTAEPSSSTEAI